MYDKKIIIPILAVIVVVLTYPIWSLFGKGAAAPELVEILGDSSPGGKRMY